MTMNTGLGFAYRYPVEEVLPSADVTTLQIPGIYSDPGGYISQQAELLRLSMGGEPAAGGGGVVGSGGRPQSPAAFPLDKNTVWLIAGVIVAAVVVSKR